MRNRTIIFILVLSWMMTLFPATPLLRAGVPGGQPVAFGERPAVDYSKISTANLEPGIIRIRFKKTLSDHLNRFELEKNRHTSTRFGIPEVDALNERFSVIQLRQTFYIVMADTLFDARHRAWGLHLWYDLIVPAGTNLMEMVAAYAQLDDLTRAEPVIRKELIGEVILPAASPEPPPSPATTFTTNDPQFSQQWHYQNTGQNGGTPGADIKLPQAWDITTGNSNVIVAVVDGGIEYTHPDLAGNMWPGNGYNFVTNSTTLVPQSHGTHVAGTVAANTDNGIGVSGIAGGSGTGNGVRLMSCQVFTSSSAGGFENAPVWAADHGAAITQNSWVYTEPNSYDQPVLDGIDYFIANGGGAVMDGGLACFAAGNSNNFGLYYPGSYSKVIGIAGTTYQDKKAYYSNYGYWVDIAAPGGETNVNANLGVRSTTLSGTYGFSAGTSMACPHVSGAAALVVSLAAGHITPDDVREILLTTTDNIDALNPSYAGKLGTGRLNAYAALQKTQAYMALYPPVSLTATPMNTSRIDLSWSSNNAGDSVILAFNTSAVFGNPTGNYQPGDAIAGGGTILYKGTLANFAHTGLVPATAYHYALWTKNGSSYSTIARKADATTDCFAVTGFPWTEGFENGGNIPLCWSQEAVDTTTVNWRFINGNGYNTMLSAAYGSYNACFSDGTSTPDKTILVSPCLNLLTVVSPKLKFYHVQPVWGTDQDQLRVYYKTSGSGNWNLLSEFTTSITGWKADSILLPNGSSTYYVGFEGTANYGHGVCLDQVSITGTASRKTLNLKAYLEGLYAGSGTMRPVTDYTAYYYSSSIADRITVELHDAATYATIAYSDTAVMLGVTGAASLVVPGSLSGSYYITVKPRNGIETTSALPVSFVGSTVSYDFTDAVTKAYGNNLVQTIDGSYALFSGDVNADGFVDTGDMSGADNLSASFATGYYKEDLTGDGFVDTGDMSLFDNNWASFVVSELP